MLTNHYTNCTCLVRKQQP